MLYYSIIYTHNKELLNYFFYTMMAQKPINKRIFLFYQKCHSINSCVLQFGYR